MKVFFNLLVLLGTCFLLNSCNTKKKINLKVSQTSYCAPPSAYVYDSTYIPLTDIKPLLQFDTLLAKKYSYEDLLIANATGTLYLLQDLVYFEQIKSEKNLVYILLKKQQVFSRLLLASTEIA